MKLESVILEKGAVIRLGASLNAKQSKNLKGTYGGGEPYVIVTSTTEVNKVQTEYGRNQSARNFEDFRKLCEQFPDTVNCAAQPGTWEHTTLEEKHPELQSAVLWQSVPYTEDWRNSPDDLGDMHF